MGLSLDPTTMELHNLVKRDGKLQTRAGLVSLKTPTAGTQFVAGFSVENPTTSEVWHYLFEQSTTTSVVTLRVFTEEYSELFSLGLGPMAPSPVVTYAVVNNQLMINSPSFAVPLYGLVGGGVIAAAKVSSGNEDLTALEIPVGHICAWNGRVIIAQGDVLFVNIPPATDEETVSTDPRCFVAQNVLAVGGAVYDLFQGPDGALYVFTSKDVYVLPADILSQAQISVGFMASIPGVSTSGPGNAATSNGAILALSDDGAVVVSRVAQDRIDLAPYEGRRYWSVPNDVDDYRCAGTLHPTTNGFVLGFGARHPFLLEIDLRRKYRSFVWSKAGTAFHLVGTLRGRGGESLYLLADRVVQPVGTADYDGNAIRGVACGRIDTPADTSIPARFITVASDAVGQSTLSFLGSAANSVAVPTKTADVVIGTSLWSASGTFAGRESRTVRHALAVRVTDLQLEIGVEGGRKVLELCDLESRGQGTRRRDRS